MTAHGEARHNDHPDTALTIAVSPTTNPTADVRTPG
jgi:hypothetical protein